MNSQFQKSCIEIHYATIALASQSSDLSAKRYESSSNDIVRDALYILLHDAVCVYRATFELARAGWSDSAAVVTRTLLDLRISQLAILNSSSPQLAAFKYLYSGLRDFSRNPEFDSKARNSIREQIRSRISLLSPDERALALAAIKDKSKGYWFAPEWSSPSEVLTEFENAETSDDYRQYSAATHGGYFGLRTYREEPDRIDINPRAELGKLGCMVALSSSSIMVNIMDARSEAESLGMSAECNGVRQQIAECALSRHDGKTASSAREI